MGEERGESQVGRELEKIREDLEGSSFHTPHEEMVELREELEPVLQDREASFLHDISRFDPMDTAEEIRDKQKKTMLMALPALPAAETFSNRANIPIIGALWLFSTVAAYDLSGPEAAAAVGISGPAYLAGSSALIGYSCKRNRANPHIVDREDVTSAPIHDLKSNYFQDISIEDGGDIIESANYVRLTEMEQQDFEIFRGETARELYENWLEDTENTVTAKFYELDEELQERFGRQYQFEVEVEYQDIVDEELEAEPRDLRAAGMTDYDPEALKNPVA